MEATLDSASSDKRSADRAIPVRYHFDAASIHSSGMGVSLALNGWCFHLDSDDIAVLQVRIGQRKISEFRCELIRKDVKQAFEAELSGDSALPKCGFSHGVQFSYEFESVEVYCVNSDQVLLRLTRENIVKLDSPWMLSPGQDEALTVPALTEMEAFTLRNTISPSLKALLSESVSDMQYKPIISLIMPVYNVAQRYIQDAVESVLAQAYPYWELCIADDASTNEETLHYLASLNDERIKITYRQNNGHICRASNDASQSATGDFIALMDNDDMLAPHALFEMVRLLQHERDADLIYSDEDKVGEDGKHYDLHFKPDWSPSLLLGYNYINHLTCIRRSLFESVGRFRLGYEGAQDYDLLLRVTEKTDKIFHIPKVLYHWRAIPGSTALSSDEKSIVGSAAHKALIDAIQRRQIPAEVYQPEFAKKRALPIQQLNFSDVGPSIDIIIPTFNMGDILKVCIDSILSKTSYKNYKILVIDNDSSDQKTLAYLKGLPERGVRVEKISNDDDGFSFSRVNNLAVELCDSEFVLFLNNDTEVIDPMWLSRMAGYLQLPGVGVAGARLLYPDDTLQHAGVILGMGGGYIPDHAFNRMHKDEAGYFFLPGTSRECSAVTGACLLTRRETFLSVGGFDEKDFRISLNDIDLCLKIEKQNLSCVYVAGAELYHHESLTRSSNDDPIELANFRAKYTGNFDRYYGPNLSRKNDYVPLPECTLDYTDIIGRPLRVVFFTHSLNFEGAPNILFDVARGLKSSGKVEPIIVSSADGPQRKTLRSQGIEVEVLSLRQGNDTLHSWTSTEEIETATTQFLEFLKNNNADVVVANIINSFIAIHAASQANIPAIWWIHESYDKKIMQNNLGEFAFPVAEAAFSKASNVLFVSNDTSELYRRYNTQNNFKVIHNSIDSQEIASTVTAIAKREAREKLGIAQNKKIIISVGTVCERKDQGTLVEAVNILAEQRDDFVLYLVGYRDSLEYGPYIKELIRQYSLQDKVILVAESDQIEHYYLAADIFAFSSLNESYSLSVLEAMAYGLPIVTTRCCGVGEQVRVGTNAYEAGFRNAKDFSEKIEILLKDGSLRRKFGVNSQEIIRYMQGGDEMLEKHGLLIAAACQVVLG